VYSVLVADDSEEWRDSMAAAIAEVPWLTLSGTAGDGREVLEIIERERPDIIISDIVMPEYDGVYIVNYIKHEMRGYAPIVYMLSGFGTSTVISMLNDLDIDFYSMKPVELKTILRNIEAILRKRKAADTAPREAEPEAREQAGRARAVLRELGAAPGLVSTLYAIEIIELSLQYGESSRILTKILYPEVAKKYGVTVSSVEKNIRGAVLQMQKKKTALFERVFAYHGGGKISNGAFILSVSDYIRSGRES
jgi:two-component system response regulator (stage 0 sporulation protein A)